MSAMKDITIRNPEQLGRAIRLKRQEKAWSQNALAARLGVDRKWVIHLEAGNAKAEFGLVLKAVNTLGLSAHLHDENQSHAPKERQTGPSRLDDVFRQLQRPERK
jgi:ribosome-binding protein aMBF1 (putative translation factor)